MGESESFLSHLVELRQRLVRGLAVVLIFVLCLFPWAREIYGILAMPMLDAMPKGGQMIATDVIGPFLVPLKVTMLVAFVAALPYVLYQAWAFVAPGLYTHEKNLVLPLVITSFLLFLVGMAYAYFFVFPVIFKFMSSVAPQGVAWMTDIDKYFSFVLTSFIAFGVTFEVPIVVIVLVRTNIVSIEKLKEARPYVIVGAFVVAAVFTPPDVVSQFLLAVPLCLLYELGILVSMFFVRKTTRIETEVAPFNADDRPSA
jgi:sec-independent protein translocase protein TatC